MIAQSNPNLNNLFIHDHHLIRSTILAVEKLTSNESYDIIIFKAINKPFSNFSFKELLVIFLTEKRYSITRMNTYHIYMP